MKGGNIYSFKGRPVSAALALVVLVLFSTLLWTWETNPIATTFRSAQEWYHLPSGLYSSQKYVNDINHLPPSLLYTSVQMACRFRNNVGSILTISPKPLIKAASIVDNFFYRKGRSHLEYGEHRTWMSNL